MSADDKDYLDFGLGALLFGFANIFAFAVLARLPQGGDATVGAWIIGWSIFVVDLMILLTVASWKASGNK